MGCEQLGRRRRRVVIKLHEIHQFRLSRFKKTNKQTNNKFNRRSTTFPRFSSNVLLHFLIHTACPVDI